MPLSDYFSSPTSFRLLQEAASQPRNDFVASNKALALFSRPDFAAARAHPDFGHLTLLVFEAVLEVVCVSLPGYIVARMGMFDAESQKFLANLNVLLFTPCLIFTKLASQLTAEKLAELAIIPVIFIVQTIISYACAWLISKCFRFKKRQANFVIAMGVFGNSNSLPISLVISLSQTLKGLHWKKIPGDNDDEVGARGILYLLIFQQLGQLVRWTWGYNVLLAPADRYTEEDGGTMQVSQIERGRGSYREDSQRAERRRLLSPGDSDGDDSVDGAREAIGVDEPAGPDNLGSQADERRSAISSSTTSLNGRTQVPNSPVFSSSSSNGDIAAHKSWSTRPDDDEASALKKAGLKLRRTTTNMTGKTSKLCSRIFKTFPRPLQKVLSSVSGFIGRFCRGLWEFMNPPLWAMLIAIVVASIPQLQHLFFDPGTFVRNSVTRAVQQSGGVAVPLILVVLGGNLARNTLPKASAGEISDPKEERKLLIASLVSRMLLPTIIMAPLLAVTAKFVPVSILDDKIFIIVCFLLTGAPTALQLAQICQINNVYMPVMSNILFQSYVIWILPSTLFLVLMALETVAWAER